MELRCGLKSENFTKKKRDNKIIPKRIGYHGTGLCLFILYRPTFYLPSININLVDVYGLHSCRYYTISCNGGMFVASQSHGIHGTGIFTYISVYFFVFCLMYR